MSFTILQIPSIWADFNNMDSSGRVRLGTVGSQKSIAESHNDKSISRVEEGAYILLYDEEVRMFGVVEFSQSEQILVVREREL